LKKYILITGCAGFIGFHLAKKLLKNSSTKVVGIDNLNNYYDIKLKKKRLLELKKFKNFYFKKIDISNYKSTEYIFKKFKPEIVINLAAQAGVRYSMISREPYMKTNLIGFYNLLELCKINKVKKFVFASTSSVYGDNKKYPLKENFSTDKPKSFYAATKKCNEIMAYAYSQNTNCNFIGLRFFTVYGPNGRPDMSLFKFMKLITKNKSVDIYNYGKHSRDFTYVDDVVDGIIKSINIKNLKNNFEIFNLCRGKIEKLNYLIYLIGKVMNKKIRKNYLPMQAGDVEKTFGCIYKSKKFLNYSPKVNLKQGLEIFYDWFKKEYSIK